MTTPKYTLKFHETDTPITDAVTKFGGQPVWLDTPQWPLSRSTGNQMQFIGQVQIYPEIFGHLAVQMAYLFISEDLNGQNIPITPQTFAPDQSVHVLYTWEPDGGENAVILQPGTWQGPSLPVATGPALWKWDSTLSRFCTGPYCEYRVSLLPGDDPDLPPQSKGPYIELPLQMSDGSLWQQQPEETEEKIGGTAQVRQYRVFPEFGSGDWQLVLQFPEQDDRFFVNFAEDGIGYVFMTKDGKQAKFGWSRI